jgi:uncharacterized protein DUF3604
MLAMAALAAGCRAEPTALAATDYLSTDLRRDVEKLKRDVAREPTTAKTVAQRVDVLWPWVNAYALTGGPIPVNLPLEVTMVRWGAADGRGPEETIVEDMAFYTLTRLASVMDGYVREFTLKDEKPAALGELRLQETDALTAGTWVTVHVTYTVGSLPMQPGGALLIGTQYMGDQGREQLDDPKGDNFVSISSSRQDARFEAVKVPLSGLHGGFVVERPTPAYRLVGPALQPGDTVTLTYGDRSGGSRGLKTQTFTTDALVFAVYVDLDGKGSFFTPRWPSVEVQGGPVHSVWALAPSVVDRGETFTLGLRSQDALYNRAAGATPAYRVLLDGKPAGEVAAGRNAVATLPGLRIGAPGIHRFTVESADGALRATSNPVWVRADASTPRVLWGETHGHSGFAEGQGTAAGYFRYAREDSRLDFVTLSEHDFWMDDFEWKTLEDQTRLANQNGLIAFQGYEWTAVRSRGGHHNVLFRTPGHRRVPVQEAGRLPALYQGLRREVAAKDVVVIPHAHMSGDWTQSDADLERLAEIYSMHGTFEWFGNRYLRNGFEVGFVGASDDHRAQPGAPHGLFRLPLAGPGGLAGVLAPERGRDPIFDALRSRSVYATSGQRILLDAKLNGHPMGRRQPDAPKRKIECRVSGTSPIDRIDVVKNGEIVFTRRYLGAALDADAAVLLGFESESDVFTLESRAVLGAKGMRAEEMPHSISAASDSPRPYRRWKGTLEVEGARVTAVTGPGLDNVILDGFTVDSASPNRVTFDLLTRGRRDALLVKLAGASTGTTFRIHLEPTKEEGWGRPETIRPAADLPGADLVLPFTELTEGRLERELRVDPHTDRVTLEIIDPDSPLDRDFEFTDLENPAPGDYYYVRVTQLDSGRAWSSPFWVGERRGAKDERPGR